MRMTSVFEILEGTSSAWLWFFFDCNVKVALLFAAAVVLARLLQHSSAAVRDRIWVLTFGAAIVLPALTGIVPQWRLPLIQFNSESSVAVSRSLAVHTDRTERLNDDATLTHAPSQFTVSEELAADQLPRANQQGTTAMAQHQASTATAKTGDRSINSSFDFSNAVSTIWLVGLSLFTVPFLLAVVSARRLFKIGRTLSDPTAIQLLGAVSSRLGISRPVSLLQVDGNVVPMAIGIWRSAVVLPATWIEWPIDRLRLVLLHELTHVKRRDVLVHSIARLICAIYWFNPLAWYALNRMRRDCELACDDQVINSGELASSYAGQLIEIARLCRPLRFTGGIAMARSSKLTERVEAILDSQRLHTAISPVGSRRLVFAATVMVVMLATITIGKRNVVAIEPEPEKPKPAAANDQPAKPPAPAAERVEQSAEASDEKAKISEIIRSSFGPFRVITHRHLGSSQGGIFDLAGYEAVQKDLGLDEEAVKKLRPLFNQIQMAKNAAAGKLDRDNRELVDKKNVDAAELKDQGKKLIAAYEEQIQKTLQQTRDQMLPKLREALTANQLERLKQLAWQAYGSYDLVVDAELLAALNLKQDQVDKIRAINQEFAPRLSQVIRSQAVSTKLLELDRDRDVKAIEVLSAEQQEGYARLKGKSFNLALFMTPPAWGSTRPAGAGARADRIDIGGLFRTTDYAGIFNLLENMAVRQELKLREETITKISAIQDQFASAWQEAGGSVAGGARARQGQPLQRFQQPIIPSSGLFLNRRNDSDEARVQLIADQMVLWNTTTAKFIPPLKEAMTAEQFARFQQINWQAMGTSAFSDSEVIQALSITNEQQEKIKSLVADYRLKRQKLNSGPGMFFRQPGPVGAAATDEVSKEQDALEKDLDTKLREALTNQQLEQFTTLKGPPFRFPLQPTQPPWYLFESGLRGGLFSILRNASVQEDAALSFDDVAKVTTIQMRFNTTWRDAGGRFRIHNFSNSPGGGGGGGMFQEPAMPPFGLMYRPVAANDQEHQDIAKQIADGISSWNTITAKYQDELKQAISQEQYTRLQQIKWQAMRSLALSDPDLVQALGVTAEQQDRIATLMHEYRIKRQELVDQGGSEGGVNQREQIRKVTAHLKQSAIDQDAALEKVLTKEQLDQFAVLKGKPFDIQQLLDSDQHRPETN